MSDPRRLRHGDDLPGEVLGLLRAAPRPRALDGAAQERVAQRLARQSHVESLRPAPGPRASVRGSTRPPRGTVPSDVRRPRSLAASALLGVGASLWLKGIAAAAVLALTGTIVATAVVPRVQRPALPPVTAPERGATPQGPAVDNGGQDDRKRPGAALAPVPDPIPDSVPAPAPAPAPARDQRAAPTAVVTASVASSVAPAPVPADEAAPTDLPRLTLADEARLIEAARTDVALHPGAALQRLDEHARTFPHGQLVEERELLAVDALIRSNHRPEAQARADAFLAQHPNGLYADRVRKLIAR